MSSSLPHSTQLQNQLNTFINDIEKQVFKVSKFTKTSTIFRNIFKYCNGTYIVLNEFSKKEKTPLINAAAGSVRRIPILLSSSQFSLNYLELRRFIELLVWACYFKEHHIEWKSFNTNPSCGYTKNEEKPISYCAHRDVKWYINYIKERFEHEPSGLGLTSINDLGNLLNKLHSNIHAANSFSPHGSLADSFDIINDTKLKELLELIKNIFAASLIILSAYNYKKYSKLTTIPKDWLHWVIGKTKLKQIRSGEFGLK